MEQDSIGFCHRRIAEEERLAESARTPEDAASHHQLALLYKAQLRILSRGQGAEPVDGLAGPLAA